MLLQLNFKYALKIFYMCILNCCCLMFWHSLTLLYSWQLKWTWNIGFRGNRNCTHTQMAGRSCQYSCVLITWKININWRKFIGYDHILYSKQFSFYTHWWEKYPVLALCTSKLSKFKSLWTRQYVQFWGFSKFSSLAWCFLYWKVDLGKTNWLFNKGVFIRESFGSGEFLCTSEISDPIVILHNTRLSFLMTNLKYIC